MVNEKMAMMKAPETNYKSSDVKVPRYRYARIVLNNITSGQVAFQPTSITLLEWRLPASTVFNLGKSFVSCQLPIAAGAAGQYTVIQEGDGCLFRQCYFGNGSGLGIVDLQFTDAYVSASRPSGTCLKDHLTRDQLQEFYPCRQAATTNIFPFSLDGLLAGTANSGVVPQLEHQHVVVGPLPATQYSISRYWPLNSVKKSILSDDKDLVFGQDMYLRLWTNMLQRIAFYTTTPANPNVAANFTAITTSATASNIYLFLAIEENLEIRNSLLASLSSGSVRMQIPYTYAYRFSSPGNNAVANVSLTLTKAYGKGVRSIMYVPMNAQEYNQYAFDHSNVNGTKVNTFQSSMDGRPLIDYVMNCYNPYSTVVPTGIVWAGAPTIADDWRENMKYLQDTAVLSYPCYQSKWFNCDSWGQPWTLEKDGYCGMSDSQIDCCFDLTHTGDHVYAINAQTTASQTATSSIFTSGLINYIFVTFLRTLVIQPDGIILEN